MSLPQPSAGSFGIGKPTHRRRCHSTPELYNLVGECRVVVGVIGGDRLVQEGRLVWRRRFSPFTSVTRTVAFCVEIISLLRGCGTRDDAAIAQSLLVLHRLPRPMLPAWARVNVWGDSRRRIATLGPISSVLMLLRHYTPPPCRGRREDIPHCSEILSFSQAQQFVCLGEWFLGTVTVSRPF